MITDQIHCKNRLFVNTKQQSTLQTLDIETEAKNTFCLGMRVIIFYP